MSEPCVTECDTLVALTRNPQAGPPLYPPQEIKEKECSRKFLSRAAPLSARLCTSCCITLLITAYAGSVSIPTATPTTVLGPIAPLEQTTPPFGLPTEAPTQGSPDQGQVFDICSLATAAEAELVLGQTVAGTTPGSEADSVLGGRLDFCTYLGSGLALVVSKVDASSPEGAAQAMQEELANIQADDPTTALTAQMGLGDQACWAAAPQAAAFYVVKGNHVIGVLLGGNIGDLASHQAALRTLTVSIVAHF
jgi:hypothetical protein